MSKVRIHFLFIFIFLGGSFFPSLQAQADGSKSLFWKISGNGLEKSSYLFGTMHIIPKKQFHVYKEADNKLKSCDQLVLEMIIDVPLSQKIEWAKQMMLPDGLKLTDYMDSEETERIRSYAIDSLGVREIMYNTYLKRKPFAFYSALVPHAIGENIEGYELHYLKIASKKEIPVLGLETFEFQMAVFDSIPEETQVDMLFPEDMDMRRDMNDLLRLYFSQDIYVMAEQVMEGNAQYSKFEKELVSARNHNWIEVLDSEMKTKSCFIAVGAGHLAGKNGLIGLLREKGYRVEPICLIQGCK